MTATNPQSPPDAAALAAEVSRLTAALTLAERDRQLLGYEIHDGIVQDLAAAAMLLDGASRQATFASSEVAENYASGLRLLRESVAAARRLIGGLAAVELDERGFMPALERLAAKFRSDLALPVKLECHAAALQLPDSTQRLLLRIVQEALFNIWKHSHATEAKVELHFDGQQLDLTVADNGAGFDPAHTSAGHYGLEGMRARAQILGAALTIDSTPGHGTRIVVRLNTSPAV